MVEQRGLEWNILVYRLINEAVFSKLIQKIDPYTKSPFDKDCNKISKKQLIKIIIFGIVLIFANCFCFYYFKQQSLFEIMNLPRLCTEDQIDRAFQDQQKVLQHQQKGFYVKQFQQKERELAEIKDILRNPTRRVIYDKYGIISSQYAYYLTPAYTMQQILQTGVSYLILLLVSIAGTGQQEKSIIKWQVLLIINFFMIEVYLLQSDPLKADLIDLLLPKLTIQHRIQILKFLLVPVSIIVGYITSKLTPNKVRNMQNKIVYLKTAVYSQLLAMSNQLANAENITDERKIEAKKLNESLLNQQTLLEETHDIIALKTKEQNKWDVGSIVKFLVIGYIMFESFNKQ